MLVMDVSAAFVAFQFNVAGWPQVGLRLRRGKLCGNWRDRHHCAGHTCVESRLRPKSQSLLKVFWSRSCRCG